MLCVCQVVEAFFCPLELTEYNCCSFKNVGSLLLAIYTERPLCSVCYSGCYSWLAGKVQELLLNIPIHRHLDLPTARLLTSCGSSMSYLRMEDMNCRCLFCSSSVTTSCSLSCSRCWAPASSSLNHWFSWHRRRTWGERKEKTEVMSKGEGKDKEEKGRRKQRCVKTENRSYGIKGVGRKRAGTERQDKERHE